MAQITNISNSADYQSINRSTTISDDEVDDQQQEFLTPSLDIGFPCNIHVDPPHLTVEISESTGDDDSITTDEFSRSTHLMNIPMSHTYINLSSSSSESSLARPLLHEKHRHFPLYNTTIINDPNEKSSSPTPSDPRSTFNYRSFLKFYLIDMILSAFVITPLVNIHWRGAWDLLDLYLLPQSERLSALISLIVALCILYVIYLLQNFLQSTYEKHREDFLGHFLTRFYTLIIAFAYINQWRGLWNLFDFTSNLWHHLFIEMLISIFFLLVMKSIYNLNSAPFLIGADTECYFIIGSKVRVANNRFVQYTFDFLFYEIVEAPLVVIAWRGLYNLSDLYICPEEKSWSMLISFIIGYLLFFLLGLVQIPLVQCFLKQRFQTMSSFTSNIVQLIAFVSVVQIWRSLWMLCEQYIDIPNNHNLTLWLCYIVAYLILTCALASCSLNGPGGSKENSIDGQPILLFKFEYMSTLIKSQFAQAKLKRVNQLISDSSSSTETIITGERPYRFEPP